MQDESGQCAQVRAVCERLAVMCALDATAPVETRWVAAWVLSGIN